MYICCGPHNLIKLVLKHMFRPIPGVYMNTNIHNICIYIYIYISSLTSTSADTSANTFTNILTDTFIITLRHGDAGPAMACSLVFVSVFGKGVCVIYKKTDLKPIEINLKTIKIKQYIYIVKINVEQY